MLKEKDLITVDLDESAVTKCKDQPDAGCHNKVTGQLRMLGNTVLCKLFGITPEEYEQQKLKAAELGVGCLIQASNDSRPIGLSAAVSIVGDEEVLSKHVILPSRQTKKHQDLAAHYTVGIFITGEKTKETLVKVNKILVAGWAEGREFKRWIKPHGAPPFQTQHTALAIAPCDILKPIDLLMNKVKWDKACV